MTVSLDDALKLFRSWRDISARIRVSFSGGASLPDNVSTVRVNVEGGSIAVEAHPGTVYIQGDDCSMEIDLRGSVLSLCDPKLDKFGGESYSSQFSAALEATLTNGEKVLFLAFRRPS